MRHGAHHSAQKSTRTGLFDCSTSFSKELSVTYITFSLIPLLLFLDCFVGQAFLPVLDWNMHWKACPTSHDPVYCRCPSIKLLSTRAREGCRSFRRALASI